MRILSRPDVPDRSFGGGKLRGRQLPAVRLSAPLPTLLDNAGRWNLSSYAYDHSYVDQVIGVRNQYVFAADENMAPRLFRRTINSDAQSVRPGSWASVDLSAAFSSAPVGVDSHHIACVELDADGYVHLIINAHSDPLTGRYAWSTVARSMTAGDYAAGSMTGVAEEKFVYPMFVRRSDGKLLLIYNNGDHEVGRNTHVKLYTHDGSAPSAAKWSDLHNPLVDGKGDPVGVREAYFWQPSIDPATGDIYLFFCWRIGSLEATNPTQNEKLACIRSTDDGVTWERVDGTAITLPITQADYTGAMVVDNIAATSNLLFVNQGSTCIDSLGRPHIAYMKVAGGTSAMHHAYWNGSAWTVTRLPIIFELSVRPMIVADNDGRAYVVYQSTSRGRVGEYRIADVTPGADQSFTDGPLIRFPMGSAGVIYDEAAARLYDEIHMMVGYAGNVADNDTTTPRGDFIGKTLMATLDVDQLAVAARGMIDVPELRQVAAVPIAPFGGEIEVSGAVGNINAPKYTLTDDLRDRHVFARFRGVARVQSGSTLTLKIAETVLGGATTLHGDHRLTDTADAVHVTPWQPLTALLAGGADGDVTVHAGVTTGSGVGWLRGVLEIGALDPTETFQ